MTSSSYLCKEAGYHVPCLWLLSPGIFRSHHQGPVSISKKTSYRKISWSLEAARFVFRIVWSLWNLTGTSAALLPMCLSNFKSIRQFKVPISWLRDFTRSYDKTSFRILRRGPERLNIHHKVNPDVTFDYRHTCVRKVSTLYALDCFNEMQICNCLLHNFSTITPLTGLKFT